MGRMGRGGVKWDGCEMVVMACGRCGVAVVLVEGKGCVCPVCHWMYVPVDYRSYRPMKIVEEHRSSEGLVVVKCLCPRGVEWMLSVN